MDTCDALKRPLRVAQADKQDILQLLGLHAAAPGGGWWDTMAG